jgi:hypothetical protein
MLLKTLVLVVLAWFVIRAAGNLIRAATTGDGIPESGPRGDRRFDGRRSERGAARSGRTGPGGVRPGRAGSADSGSAPPIVVHRRRGAEAGSSASPRHDDEDIEDARFEDL